MSAPYTVLLQQAVLLERAQGHFDEALARVLHEHAEMLEALKDAEAFIERTSGGGETAYRQKLNEVIARAEGRTP